MPPWLMTDRPTEDQGRLGDPPGAKSQGGFDCRWGAHARCIGVADDTPPELALFPRRHVPSQGRTLSYLLTYLLMVQSLPA